jgi:hypothetical protein
MSFKDRQAMLRLLKRHSIKKRLAKKTPSSDTYSFVKGCFFGFSKPGLGYQGVLEKLVSYS